jgi:uncharacterized protein involved in outer membrane biogenesis
MRRKLVIAAIVLVVLAAGAALFARVVLGSDLVRSSIEQQLAARLGLPVKVGSASVGFWPRGSLDLRDITIGTLPAMQFGQIQIVTGLRGLIARRVTDAEVVVTRGHVTFPLPLTFTTAASRSTPEPGASSSFTVQSVQLISLREVTLVGDRQSLLVDLDSSIEGDRLDIKRLIARAKTTTVQASGTLTSIARLEGALDAKADPLDLDEMIDVAAALTTTAESPPSPGRPAEKAAPMHIVVKLASPAGTFNSYAFKDLSTTIEIVPGRLTLTPLSVGAFGGSFGGRLDVDSSGVASRLNVTGRVDGLDVVELLQSSGAPGGISGRLGGSVSLRGVAAETGTMIRTAQGAIHASVTDGSIPGLEIVRPIVLAFGKPSGAPVEGSGSAFSRLAGDFVMAAGSLTSENLTMNSRDFDLSGRGTLQILTGAVDARTDVVLSRELTAQSGTDLRRFAQQDGRVVVPATISGTLQRPSVAPDLAAAVRRALGNELQRRATSLLEGLFKKKKDQ